MRSDDFSPAFSSRSRRVIPVLVILLAAFEPAVAAPQNVLIEEIGPRHSTLDEDDPDGASGGRVNALATVVGNRSTYYAASEWGGLWVSRDSALTWQHLPGHVPTATWDVEVDPADPNRIYATSRYDGRVDSLAGINVSLDAGVTWHRPPTATPPVGLCEVQARRQEPSAFGIAVDPGNPDHVYVGTNCGLAVSHDRAVTWTFVDPTPADGADNIWDVIVHNGGIIDVCGDLGHARSTDGGATWQSAPTVLLPSGVCSLAISPDEPHVLFAVTGKFLFESDDGGQSWPVTYVNPSPQGRIPFFVINDRSGDWYDLWFGDVGLFRASCKTPTPAVPGGSRRCQPSNTWAGPFTRDYGGHDDVGDLVFDSEGGVENACPILFSSDGGVYYNSWWSDSDPSWASSPACQTPFWEQPDETPRALWSWTMAAVTRPGALAEDLYFGNQDNGSFGSRKAGDADPGWINDKCCDVFDVAADADRVVSAACCFAPPHPSTRIWISDPSLTTGDFLASGNAPPGTLREFEQLPSIANFGPNAYVVATYSGVYITTDITAPRVSWTRLGFTAPFDPCGLEISRGAGGVPVFYVKNGGCDGDRQGELFRYDGTAPSGSWRRITRGGASAFGVYDVDPNDADRILASDLANFWAPEMVMTLDGGATWQHLSSPDVLMTGGGRFHFTNRRGLRAWGRSDGYPQPTLVAFDPIDPNLIVAGAADAGVFLSTDAGINWETVTDPNTPGATGQPHLPRPRYAHFDHDMPGAVRIYLGTVGRGVWRLTVDTANP